MSISISIFNPCRTYLLNVAHGQTVPVTLGFFFQDNVQKSRELKLAVGAEVFVKLPETSTEFKNLFNTALFLTLFSSFITVAALRS